MGIAHFLKSGEISLDPDRRCILVNGTPDKKLAYDQLSPTDWGQVYEKYVGQVYESRGFKVTYHGLDKGFFDRGIDLIVEDELFINFVQCKFTNQKIAKSSLDWILYKASRKLLDEHESSNKKLFFTLVINSLENNFSKLKPKNLKLTFSNIQTVKFPWLQYFLDHNQIQNKVKLQVEEIEMNK